MAYRYIEDVLREFGVNPDAPYKKTEMCVPVPPPPRPREFRCEYCGSVVRKNRCEECGAPRRGTK